MKRIAIASTVLLLIGMASVRGAEPPKLPPPWQHQEIGKVTVPGEANFAAGVFTLKGTLDIWGKSDGCQFAWQTIQSDVTIVARIQSVELSGHSKGGLLA